jgi:membrane fusion protein, multidrug efflux system
MSHASPRAWRPRQSLQAAGLAACICIMVHISVTPALSEIRLGAAGAQPWRGVVRAVHQAALSTEFVTPVAKVGAREGQRFKAGDPLIEFDCRRQHHELSALGATVREAQVTHDSHLHLLRNGATNRNELVISQSRLEKAQADHAALQQRLTGCRIAAPFDGIVVELGVNAHELPPPNKPLMTIVSDRMLEIEVIVPSRALPRLLVGVGFEFTVDETQRVYGAKVLRAGGSVDPVSQTAKVYAIFTTTVDDVVPGMSGTALIKSAGDR